MRAIVRAVRGGRCAAEVALVLANRPGAAGLAWAEAERLPTVCVDQHEFASRAEHEEAVLAALETHEVELVCLAGYMRLLGPRLVNAYPARILNVHPSLLPAFPGLHAQRQAIEHGVAVSGATIHIVDEQLDHGPILLQESCAVQQGDTETTLATRILEIEHRLYPRAIAELCADRIRIDGRRATRVGGARP